MTTSLTLKHQRHRIRVGAEVRILRQDIWKLRNWKSASRRPHGYIVRVNGGYIYVRPLARWWKPEWPELELYDCEIEVVS